MATTRSVWQLARLADISDPESPDSPGARFLLAIQDAADEARQEIADGQDRDEAIAQGVAAVLMRPTSVQWAMFTDLAAWQEEDETGAISHCMRDGRYDMLAAVVLTQIGERLLTILLDDDQEHDIS